MVRAVPVASIRLWKRSRRIWRAGVKIAEAQCRRTKIPDVVGKYWVWSIPTLMIFKHGKLVATKVGRGWKSDLSQWIGAAV